MKLINSLNCIRKFRMLSKKPQSQISGVLLHQSLNEKKVFKRCVHVLGQRILYELLKLRKS